MNKKIVYPAYYRIILREITPQGGQWEFIKPKVFFNPLNLPIPSDIEWASGTTKKKVVTELFRLSMGKPGYYLANLMERKYYYCGSDWEDVRKTLLSLGIGRVDPMES
ncbi:hypothetical protein [Iningainema tapete]|uniref:Uncharacterized protein n=1 Tax=Iningainema tapete BLCC-T55 TaxID=2748662 RepID=A0A8J6XAC7_9CYAN|nr:hypothetical protein [Iningainema tapete]MBD2771110.1 hypothetical protein [Iningainema tapete BLCC-T55]